MEVNYVYKGEDGQQDERCIEASPSAPACPGCWCNCRWTSTRTQMQKMMKNNWIHLVLSNAHADMRTVQTIGEVFTMQTLTPAVSFKWSKLRRWWTDQLHSLELRARRGPKSEGDMLQWRARWQAGSLGPTAMSTAGIFWCIKVYHVGLVVLYISKAVFFWS